jgi:hypothetical protein
MSIAGNFKTNLLIDGSIFKFYRNVFTKHSPDIPRMPTTHNFAAD